MIYVNAIFFYISQFYILKVEFQRFVSDYKIDSSAKIWMHKMFLKSWSDETCDSEANTNPKMRIKTEDCSIVF
jgi:hypothetical protein